jgi:hypothetical protein
MQTRIMTEIELNDMTGDYGNTIPGLLVVCTRCGHGVEVFGTSERSARRGAVMLAEECPEGGDNYYVVDWED